MNIDQIEQNLRRYEIKDEQSLIEYLKLIQQFSNVVLDDNVYCEKHHICPKSMFKEYRLSKWNIINVPFEIHVEFHRLLCLIYMNNECKRAYHFVARQNMEDNIKRLTSNAYAGDSNPAKRPEVRQKISVSKTGVKRLDMKGKRYFGADEINIEKGLLKMKEKLINTVIVKNANGDRFRISIFDEKYLSGEYVPFNLGVESPNNCMKRDDVVDKVINARNEKYNSYINFSLDDVVNLLINYYNNGKKIFGNKTLFSSNYSFLVDKTKFTREEVYNAVVQRLEKV